MKKIIALAVAAVVAAPAMADLTIGASARYQIDNNAYTGAVSQTAADKAAAAANKANAAASAAQTDPFVAQPQAASTAGLQAATNRVLVSVAGSTTAESGLFVSAAATLQMTGDAGVSRDGDNAITVGNSMANVVLGAFEPAGAFSSGADQFQNSALKGYEGGLRAREASNIGLNVTAVENLTLQLSTDVTEGSDDYRLVAGYDFGAFAVTAAYESVEGADNGTTITASTEVGGVALAASYGEWGTAESLNVNASYMGFGLAIQEDQNGTSEESEVYGSYSIANAGGVEGFTVTVGAGDSDFTGVDTKYGVRLDYAF